MTFFVQADPSRENAPSFITSDRVDALRKALAWQERGYQRVQVLADGRLYTLKEFAGTILIGDKRAFRDPTPGKR